MVSTKKRCSSRYALTALCVCAMLTALYVVLNRFVSIPISSGIKIGFSMVAPIMAGALYGPISGALVYGLGDLIGALLFPQGTFLLGFTICAVAMGFLWGLFLCPESFIQSRLLKGRENSSFFRILTVLIPAVVNCLVFGLLLNTLWVSQLYGSKTYLGWFLYRLPQYAVMIPVNCVLGFSLQPLAKLLKKAGFEKTACKKL